MLPPAEGNERSWTRHWFPVIYAGGRPEQAGQLEEGYALL